MADLLEVSQTVVNARGWTLEELEQVRADKAAKRGGFEKKILLKEGRSPSNYQDIASKIRHNQTVIIEKISPQMLNTYNLGAAFAYGDYEFSNFDAADVWFK